MSFIFILLAAMGLGLLVFIHEFGHYWMARRVGIKVEVFSIGFGKPIARWVRKGVEWRIGWIPFGGYVRMLGEDSKGEVEPHEIKGGFFAARPIDRIKVALAGPVVNLVFAFLVFTLLWATGGRERSFAEYTNRVGWVDPSSELYQEGVRPGDIITSYDSHAVKTKKDHLYAPMLADEAVTVKGYHVNYASGTKKPFEAVYATYSHPMAADEGFMTLGVMAPAEYLLYQPLPGKKQLPAQTPLAGTDLKKGDRLFWMDGELIFSLAQLRYLLDEAKALVTIERDGQISLARVPRTTMGILDYPRSFWEELRDWHFALSLEGRPADTRFIPYSLSRHLTVQERVESYDDELNERLFPTELLVPLDAPLQEGDRILAVDGESITTPLQLMQALQTKRYHLIMERQPKGWPVLPSNEANQLFDRSVPWNDLDKLTAEIGVAPSEQLSGVQAGNLLLLKPIQPLSQLEYAKLTGSEGRLLGQLQSIRTKIEEMPDSIRKQEALQELAREEQRPVLGAMFTDLAVVYNPSPFIQFRDIMVETGRTLKALLFGYLNPKWLAGPIGIVHVMHMSWTVGVKEAIFWLGIISLNLGLLNLLPIPVLDGGRVCFSLWEMITRRPLKARTMERLIIPFVILMIGFFIFVTYQDLSRIIGQLL